MLGGKGGSGLGGESVAGEETKHASAVCSTTKSIGNIPFRLLPAKTLTRPVPWWSHPGKHPGSPFVPHRQVPHATAERGKTLSENDTCCIALSQRHSIPQTYLSVQAKGQLADAAGNLVEMDRLASSVALNDMHRHGTESVLLVLECNDEAKIV